jgi:hypothetical protein
LLNLVFSSTDCPETFFLLEDYLPHLQIKSEEVSDSSSSENKFDLTEICMEIEEVQKLQEQEVCPYGVFRCMYCKDGFNDLGEIVKIFMKSF